MGQVAIETRQGRHAIDDAVVVSLKEREERRKLAKGQCNEQRNERFYTIRFPLRKVIKFLIFINEIFS